MPTAPGRAGAPVPSMIAAIADEHVEHRVPLGLRSGAPTIVHRAVQDALAGRVALVTGASRGIGAAIARRFGAEGARVALVARSLEPGSGGHLAGSLRETAEVDRRGGGDALPIVADLSDPACDRAAIVAEVGRELGPVDVLVNNAAACFYLSIDETSERRLRVAYEVNVITPYLLTKAVVPGMRARGAGWIVNITSAIVDPAPTARSRRVRRRTRRARRRSTGSRSRSRWSSAATASP